MHHFKNLRVWRESIEFCKEVYQITKKFPKREQMGITRQLREAALEIPGNISRGTLSKRYFPQYLKRAAKSARDCETVIIVCEELGFLNKKSFEQLSVRLEGIERMLNSLIKKVEETR